MPLNNKQDSMMFHCDNKFLISEAEKINFFIMNLEVGEYLFMGDSIEFVFKFYLVNLTRFGLGYYIFA